ncbi:sigma factor [Actinomadura sp. NPDC000600]|uniref:sigma factor n=1 Tax=Actinomadura sp. NPDC000600 TaxID=3154262 RepID=UPI003398DBA3
MTERPPRLLRTAYLLCRDWAQAEGLLQTALVKAWRAWQRIGDHLDPYVYRILVNTHASWARRHWRRERPTNRPPVRRDPADRIGAAKDKAVLWRRSAGFRTGSAPRWCCASSRICRNRRSPRCSTARSGP